MPSRWPALMDNPLLIVPLVATAVFAMATAAFRFLGEQTKRDSILGGAVLAAIASFGTWVVSQETVRPKDKVVVVPKPNPTPVVLPPDWFEAMALTPDEEQAGKMPKPSNAQLAASLGGAIRISGHYGYDRVTPFLRQYPGVLEDEEIVARALSDAINSRSSVAFQALTRDHPEFLPYKVPIGAIADRLNCLRDDRVDMRWLAEQCKANAILDLLPGVPPAVGEPNGAVAMKFDDVLPLLKNGDVQQLQIVLNDSKPEQIANLRDWNGDTLVHVALRERVLWTSNLIEPVIKCLLSSCPDLAQQRNKAGESPSDVAKAWRDELNGHPHIDAILRILSGEAPDQADAEVTNDKVTINSMGKALATAGVQLVPGSQSRLSENLGRRSPTADKGLFRS